MTLRSIIILSSIILIIAFVLCFIFYFKPFDVLGASVITIDGSIKYQSIEGFGGSGAYYESLIYSLKEPKRTEVLDLLFSDLGISIYRLRVWTQIEFRNDDNDPNNFNWSAFRFSMDDKQAWNAMKAKERGVTKFMASVWSPPWWMKSNRKERGGGYLLPEMYEEFAEFLTAYVVGYRDKFGIEIEWISLQNEPDYVTEGWETCEYTPEQLRDLIKVVGARFRAEGLSTKIITPETGNCINALKYIPVIMSDPEAAQYIDILAHHLYDVKFFIPDSRITEMKRIAGYGATFNKSIWQTEYSYLETQGRGTFEEALVTAHHIHNVLTVENASAYFVWSLFWVGNGGLINIDLNNNSYRVNPTYYAVKQYSKFIVPGSRRIYAYSDDKELLVSAYLDKNSNSITVIITNERKDNVKARIYLRNVQYASFKQHRTSKSENCIYIGDLTVSGDVLEVTLPPESITTLVS
ncbi:MAG: glycoside hydrolase family 30 protein [Thermoproteota archaeon]